jgi:hypothetical protein
LDAHESSIVGVDGELRIGFLNAGWYRFAAQNEGEPFISERWGLGRNLWDAIPTPLHEFFKNLFATAFALNQPDQLHPLLHDYECSSPEHYRRFTLSLYPLRAAREGLGYRGAEVCGRVGLCASGWDGPTVRELPASPSGRGGATMALRP